MEVEDDGRRAEAEAESVDTVRGGSREPSTPLQTTSQSARNAQVYQAQTYQSRVDACPPSSRCDAGSADAGIAAAAPEDQSERDCGSVDDGTSPYAGATVLSPSVVPAAGDGAAAAAQVMDCVRDRRESVQFDEIINGQ